MPLGVQVETGESWKTLLIGRWFTDLTCVSFILARKVQRSAGNVFDEFEDLGKGKRSLF